MRIRCIELLVGLSLLTCFSWSCTERPSQPRGERAEPTPAKSTVKEPDRKTFSFQVPPDAELVGRWFLDMKAIAIWSQITLYKKGDDVFLHEEISDGRSFHEQLREDVSGTQRTFHFLDSSQGYHYAIRPNGDLQIRDSQGILQTAVSVE